MSTHQIAGRRFTEPSLPFHRLATRIGGASSAAQALIDAGLDYTVEKVQQEVALKDGTRLIVPGAYTMLRPPVPFDPVYRPLGLVGRGYTPLQNIEAARALDEGGFTAKWPVDAVGFVNMGQKIFISLDLGEMELAHELIHDYLLMITGHDGSTATTLQFIPCRILCTNALLLGVKDAALTASLVHERSIHADLRFRLGDMDRFQFHRSRLQNQLAALAKKHVSSLVVAEVLIETYPAPARPGRLIQDNYEAFEEDTLEITEPLTQKEARAKAKQTYENSVKRQADLREFAAQEYDRYNDGGHAANRGTAYNLYQAITGVSNHREGHTRKTGQDNVAISVLQGPRAAEMGRAWAALQRA